MKALKLDATKPDARRVARGLIGSVDDEGDTLVGVYDDGLLLEVGTRVAVCQSCKLPIDTLVFDPFAAMRDKIPVVGFGTTFCPPTEDALTDEIFPEEEYPFTIKGTMAKYDADDEAGFLIVSECVHCAATDEFDSDESWTEQKEITLDIESACRLDGVEVVEI